MSRTGLRLATATPALAALCALHTSTLVQSTLDAHAARMRASSATRTCTHTATCAHTRQKHYVVPRVIGVMVTWMVAKAKENVGKVSRVVSCVDF